jgi:hypothetical protein
MTKKIKKKSKKKDKQPVLHELESLAEIKNLQLKIKKLEKELKKNDRIIDELSGQLKKNHNANKKRKKLTKNLANPLFTGQIESVGVVQRKAWQRHGYLRDRYEFHLGSCRDKSKARVLADQDLREKYGEEAGYTEQELEQILS